MPTTYNLFEQNLSLLRTSSAGVTTFVDDFPAGWQTTNSTSTITSSTFVTDSHYSLQVFPFGSDDVSIFCESVPMFISDNGRVISFNARLRASSTVDVTTHLWIDSASAAYEPHSQSVGGGSFNAIHSNRVVLPSDDLPHTVSVRINVSGHNAGNIFMTLPNLIHDLAFYDNFFVRTSREFMPDFYFEVDSLQEYPTFPYHKLMDAMISGAGDCLNEYRSIFPYETSELSNDLVRLEYWVNSSLVNPEIVREEYTEWLCQFAGHRLVLNFPTADGGLYFENQQLVYNFIRWQLRTSYYGRAAGSRRAIAEATQQVLLRTKDDSVSTFSVAVTPNYEADPFVIKITTLANETLDADIGEESSLVLASASLAKPVGYKIVHEAVEEFRFSFDDPVLGVFDQFTLG